MDKEAELDSVRQMKECTGELVEYLEGMVGKFKELNEATEVISDVLVRWSEVFALASIRDSSRFVLVEDGVAVAPVAVSKGPMKGSK